MTTVLEGYQDQILMLRKQVERLRAERDEAVINALRLQLQRDAARQALAWADEKSACVDE